MICTAQRNCGLPGSQPGSGEFENQLRPTTATKHHHHFRAMRLVWDHTGGKGTPTQSLCSLFHFTALPQRGTWSWASAPISAELTDLRAALACAYPQAGNGWETRQGNCHLRAQTHSSYLLQPVTSSSSHVLDCIRPPSSHLQPLDHLLDPSCPRLALTSSVLPPVAPPWLSTPHPCWLSPSASLTTLGESKEAQEGHLAWGLHLRAALACSCLLDLSQSLGWHPSQVQAGPPVPQDSGAKSAEEEEATV